MKYPPTPGPWYCLSGAVYADPEGTRPIAMMIRTDEAARAGIFPVERDSNAHLIAAAPAMLDILVKVQAWLDTHHNHAAQGALNRLIDDTGLTARTTEILQAVRR